LSKYVELVSKDAVLPLDNHIMMEPITRLWLNVQHGLEVAKKF
jgi:hypothetical protein